MVSVCMITKNEQTKLEQCLQKLSNYPFEIIVVDTGSTDMSLMIADKYTDHVFSYQWKDDFSDARNYAASKATNDIILVIDTDEILTYIDVEEMEKLVRSYPDRIGRVQRINRIADDREEIRQREYIQRLYHRELYLYKGSIHEQIVSKNGMDMGYYKLPIILEHSGYVGTQEEKHKKAARNIALLNKALLTQNNDPYLLYQLGKSYYMDHDYLEACKYFEQATCYDLNPKLEYVIDLVITYGYALLDTKQYEKAAGFANLTEDFGTTADFYFLMGLIYMNLAQFDQSVASFLKATEVQDYMIEGVTSYKAFYNIGVIYECLGYKEQAIEFYNRCNGYKLSDQRLKQLDQ